MYGGGVNGLLSATSSRPRESADATKLLDRREPVAVGGSAERTVTIRAALRVLTRC